MAGVIGMKDGITPSLQQLVRDFPQHLPKALADVGRMFRNRMMKQLRAGQGANNALPPLQPITLALKRAKHGELSATRRTLRQQGKLSKSAAMVATRRRRELGFAGKLPDLVRFNSTGNSVKVGWLDEETAGISAFTNKYQDTRGSLPVTKAQHRMLRLLLGDAKQPKTWMPKTARIVVRTYQPDWSGEGAEAIRKSMLARIQYASRKAVAA